MNNGYFQDDNGNKSSVRLQSFLTLLFSFVVIAFMVYQDNIDYTICFLLMTAAFAPKQIQKVMEKRQDSK